MEMLLLHFVRSIRTLELFLDEKSMDDIADRAFILDHYNIAPGARARHDERASETPSSL